jgi:hypothetical protein
VFEGEPDLFLLGDDQRYVRLGSLPSPFGSLCVDLYYRTRMEIVPNANVSPIIEAKENGTMIFIHLIEILHFSAKSK